MPSVLTKTAELAPKTANATPHHKRRRLADSGDYTFSRKLAKRHCPQLLTQDLESSPLSLSSASRDNEEMSPDNWCSSLLTPRAFLQLAAMQEWASTHRDIGLRSLMQQEKEENQKELEGEISKDTQTCLRTSLHKANRHGMLAKQGTSGSHWYTFYSRLHLVQAYTAYVNARQAVRTSLGRRSKGQSDATVAKTLIAQQRCKLPEYIGCSKEQVLKEV